MTVRISDAIDAASLRGMSHHAFPMIEGMSPAEDLAVVVVTPDDEAGWRMLMLEGRYDGDMRVTRSGRPKPVTIREMENLVFHPVGEMPMVDVVPAVDLVRAIEGYDDDVVLHHRAARTIVEARRSQDARVPVVRSSPFLGMMRAAGIAGAILGIANMIGTIGVLTTWGHASDDIQRYVVMTTVVTLGLAAASPLLLMRLNRYSSLFSRPAARRRSRDAVMGVGQGIILLAIVSAMNGIAVLH